KTSQAREFAMNFRIPRWAEGATISVNGRRAQTAATAGTFASIHRRWNSGDRVEVDLPMKMRLYRIHPQHPQTVGLLSGLLVLFAITSARPALTAAELLVASRMDEQSWQIKTDSGPIKRVPFTEIDE